jgi:hypothetical protein
MQYAHCDTTAAFVAAMRSRGLRQAVLAWREEYGPAPTPSSAQADYRLVREVTLLGYDQGTILRCELAEADRRSVRDDLVAAGLTVEERCRNLAAPG